MRIQKIVICGFGAALTFLLTVFIVLPIPAMGYVNFGDSMILLFATFVNPVAAAFIGGVGSALADVYLGYSQYAIFTLVIKGLEGLVTAYLFHKLPEKMRIMAFLTGVLIMITGYYITDVILIGDFIAVLPAVQGNLIQGGTCFVFACIAYKPFLRISKQKVQLYKD